MDWSRTASALWTSFSSRTRREDLVCVIGVGFGMREARDRVLWAGGAASLVVAAACEWVFRAGLSVETGTGWRDMWR